MEQAGMQCFYVFSIENLGRKVKEVIKFPENMKKYLKKYRGGVIISVIRADIGSESAKKRSMVRQIIRLPGAKKFVS